ncbi:MAG: hypothetical protein IK093_19730 [Ruminiclostridium sp.]|nr:hypothetical protein [Ruminiclostridium sp.]
MKFFKNVKEKIANRAAKAKAKAVAIWAVAACNRGENYVDSGVKILIAVVIGALLLGGLYALFGDTIMPTVTTKVEEMFEFKG